ncbi:MAG: Ni/Fe-hydrogenase, b-type cytochrome subunit [Acidobacteriota bacterium]|nr:Ni/Fe-hydrogenase, b-type cytochrome subunit [Acidobacteriota bacterium]
MDPIAQPAGRVAPHPIAREEGLVRVYVWEAPVRIAHWVIVLSILVLSFTGYYLYNPFIIARGSRVFMMGTMRFIHEVAAFAFIGAGIVRAYWFFRGNRWAHWRSFVPIRRWQWQGLGEQLQYYLFLRRAPNSQVGHNPLAAITYLFVYLLMLVELLTGLALFNHVLAGQDRLLALSIGWLPRLIDIQYLRETHFLIMFAFLAFLVHHVYSAVLIGIEERSGLMGGIFSGYKFFPSAFVAADPARRSGEAQIPAVPAGRSHQAPPARPVPPTAIRETNLP